MSGFEISAISARCHRSCCGREPPSLDVLPTFRMHCTTEYDVNNAQPEHRLHAGERPYFIRDLWSTLTAVLDEDALLHLCALDPSGQLGIARRALSAFRSGSQRWRERLQFALQGHDTAGVFGVVHTFKSAAAIVGALELSRLCAETERLAHERQTERLAASVAAILAESARILSALAPLDSEAP